MKCSVLIKAFNRKQYILQAVDNLLNQSRKPDEIVVLTHFRDNFIENYFKENNIKFIYENKDTSLTDDDYTLVENATNDIIFFLDDDDLFFKDKIKNIMNIYEKENAGLVIDEAYLDTTRNLKRKQKEHFWYRKITDIHQFRYKPYQLSGISFNKSLVKEHIKEIQNSGTSNDSFMYYWLSLYVHNNYYTSKQHLWYIQKHSSSQNIIEKYYTFKSRIKTFEKLLSYEPYRKDTNINYDYRWHLDEIKKIQPTSTQQPYLLYTGLKGYDNGLAQQTTAFERIIKEKGIKYDKYLFKYFSQTINEGLNNPEIAKEKGYTEFSKYNIVFDNFSLNSVYKYVNKDAVLVEYYADLFFLKWNVPEQMDEFINSYKRADIIVFNSNLTKHNINSFLQQHNIPIKQDQYVVLPSIKESYLNYKPDWKTERKDVCYIGRYWDSYKRIDKAFELFRIYNYPFKKEKMYVFSENHDEQQIEIPNDLKDKVEFYQGKDNNFIIDKIKNCKYSFITSQYEGFGMPIIETALLGITPIVLDDAEIPTETKRWSKIVNINNHNSLTEGYLIDESRNNKLRKYIMINSDFKLNDVLNIALDFLKNKNPIPIEPKRQINNKNFMQQGKIIFKKPHF